MGCDIHTVMQVKRKNGWKTIYSNVGGEDRDYNSFAVLADVRNGSGFAGVKTGDGWVPIDFPRGLPEDFVTVGYDLTAPNAPHIPGGEVYLDFNHTYQEEGDFTQWMGDHIHSYVSLQEIEWWIEKAMPERYTRTGVVELEEFIRIKDKKLKRPNNWSGGVFGGGTKTVDASEFDPKDNTITHIRIQWTEEAHRVLHYLKKVVREMRIVAATAGVSSTDVRMVFGFDS